MKNINKIKETLEYLDKNCETDLDVLDYIVTNKVQMEKLGMEIQIDNDSVDLYFGEDSDENSLYYTFGNFGYELLNILFKYIGFNSDLV
jgi:hypothetical protein